MGLSHGKKVRFKCFWNMNILIKLNLKTTKKCKVFK